MSRGLKWVGILAVCVFGTALAAQDFPVSARVTSSRVLVYADREVLHTFENRQPSRFTVWEISSSGRHYRITPVGADYEGWVEAKLVELELGVEADRSPAYLTTLRDLYIKKQGDTTKTGCGVYIGESETIKRKWFRESFSGLQRYQTLELRKGNWKYVYRQREDAVEVVGSSEGRFWIPRDKIEVHPLIPKNNRSTMLSSNVCQEGYMRGNRRKAVALRDGTFHRGPSKTLPPVDFYKRGEEMQIRRMVSTTWFADGDRWFPASDVLLLEFPAIARSSVGELSVREGPAAHHAYVAVITGTPRIGVYEHSQGWVRITPPRSARAGWVAVDDLVVEEYGVRSSAVPSGYLASIQPKPPPQPTQSTRSRSRPRREPASSILASGCLGWSDAALHAGPPGLHSRSVSDARFRAAELVRHLLPGTHSHHLRWDPSGGVVLLFVLGVIGLYWAWRVFVHIQYLYGRHPFETTVRRGRKASVEDFVSFVEGLASEEPKSVWEMRYAEKRRRELYKYFKSQEELIAATIGHQRLQELKNYLERSGGL